MAVVIGGAGLGNYDVLGQAGIKLAGSNGLQINASTGNLVIRGKDQSLVSRGLDLSLSRTYNSQASKNDFDGDKWRFSFEREINVVGNNLRRISGDGHIAVFQKQKDGSYLSTAGSGAHDTIKKVGSDWVYTEGSSGIKEIYRGSDGRLLRTEDKSGNKVEYRYSGNRLTTISNASGEELRFVYNSKGQLKRLDSYTIVDGKLSHSHSKVHYNYDSKGRLAQVKVDLSPEDKSISDGKVFTTTYTYQDANSHLLKSIQKSDGSKITLGYQTVEGKVRLSRIDDNGVVTQLNYQSKRGNGHQLQVTDNNGEVWYYKHDNKGRLISALSPNVNYQSGVNGLPRGTGQVQGEVTYQYDDQDNLIIVRDGSGKEIQNKYDANGNLTEILRNGVLHLKHEYKGNLLVASHSYNEGKKEASAYYVYENGKLRFEISAIGNITEHSYNGYGQRTSMRRYLGANYAPSSLPMLSSMVSWAGKQDKQQTELTEYTYQRGELHTQTTYNRLDTSGRGDTIRDLEIVSWGYDFRGYSVPRRGVIIDGTHVGGNGRGVTVTVVDANNNLVSTKTFDTHGKAEASQQLAAHLNTLKASTQGTKIIVTTSDAWTSNLNQDAKNALSSLGINEKTLKNPEYRSSLISVAEANNGKWVTTHQDYRPRKPESTINLKLTNAEHIRTTYDAFGNLLSTQTLMGNIKTGRLEVKSTTTQVFDGLNRVTNTTDAAGNTVSTQYLDASRQVLVTTENGVTTRRTFSQRGELLSETVSAAGEVSRERTYIYDRSGQPVATLHANGSVSAQFYDDAGRLWLSVSNTGQATEYQRDSEGRVVREIQYESKLNTKGWLSQGKLIVSGKDVLGLIDPNAEHRVIRTEFDAQGRLHRTINAEQQVTEYTYDDQDRQVAIRHYMEGYEKSARELASEYNKAGQLISQKDAAGFIKRFYYDNAGKLTETRTYKAQGEKVYQNGHEVDLGKWQVYDSSPAGATMTPRYDADYGGEVIDLNGSGTSNGYRFADDNRNKSWKNTDMRTISWDMKYSQGMIVYISVQTEKGHRYLQYQAGNGNASISNGYARHYVGNVTNGQWNTVTRDLEADLAAVEPDNKILHVNAFLIRGTGSIGKVSLSDSSPAESFDSAKVFYDSRGRQQYVLDEQGYLTETRYLDGGREKVTYRYAKAISSKNGGIASILQQAGSAQQIARERYDAAGRLVVSTNRNGVETRYHYDDVTGLLRQQITAANTKESRSVYFDYNKFGEQTGRVSVAGSQDWKAANITSLVAQRGSKSTYNVMGWKTSDYHPATGKTEYKYDNAGRLIKQTDALGNTKSSKYSAFGDVKQRLVAGVVKAEYAYDRSGRLTREIDGEQAVTSYIYNKLGQLGYQVRQHVSDAYQTFQSGTGHLISRHITQYRYDARGNVIEQRVSQDYRAGTRISGGDTLSDVRSSHARYKAQWSRKYDHLGRVISEQDGAGREKVIDYLHGGRIKTVKLSGALQERIELDALGRTLSLANGKGETTRFEYDDTRNTVTVVSPGGIRTVTEKNAHGETTSITDGLGNRRLFHYNHNGQVIRTEFRAAGSSTSEILSKKEYDSKTGLLQFETNAEGTRTEVRYNAIGQQWKVIRDVNGEKLQTEYGYDKQGQQIWENTEGRRTYIRYDNNGRKVRVEQGGVATLYQYDATGKVIRMVEGAVSGSERVLEERVTEYSYDESGNLLDKRIKSGSAWSGSESTQTTRYSYDGAGNVLEKATGVGATSRYVYDSLGRVKYEINALNYVTQFHYDAANRTTKTVRYGKAIAHQATWTEQTVSAAIKASAATDRSTEVRYDNEGRIAFEINGKGYATGYEYNANGQVIKTTRYHKPVTASNWNAASSSNRVSQSIYDAHGRLQYAIDAQGRISERGYDKEGRITHTIRYDTDFELVNRSASSINALKTHLSAEVEAGRVRAELSVYDQLGRKRFTLDGDGFLVEYQYNRQSLKIRKKEYVDDEAILKALNDVRKGQAAMTEYAVFLKLAESLQSLDNASVELKAQLSELNHQQGRISNLFKELSVLESQISATNNANHDLGISIENANNRLAGLQKEVEIELARHAELQKKIDELGAEIAEHEARLKGQNTEAVNAAKKAVDDAKAALSAANSAKAQTAATVRASVKGSTLTALHPEWKTDYATDKGKIWNAVNGDTQANSALSLVAGHRKVLIKGKDSLHQQYQAALAIPDAAKAAVLKEKLDQTVSALEYLDKLAADIQADITARARIENTKLALNDAQEELSKAVANQNNTNNAISGNPDVAADNASTAINKPQVGSEDVVISATPGSTTETLDKIDALKSKLQILTADIDSQKSTVELKTASLTQREEEYAVARAAYNKAQAERQAEINAAKKAVNNAQKVRDAAWAEYQAALKSKNANIANQQSKQAAYNSAKAKYDSALKSQKSAQTASNNANSALASANTNLTNKTNAYKTAQSNYNYHHGQWVNADKHYKYTISKRDAAWRSREAARKDYERAAADYNAYSRRSRYTEENPSGRTSSGLNSRRASRDAKLRTYRSRINSHNYWVDQANKAYSARKSKWDTRARYLNTFNIAKNNLSTATTQKNTAQTNASNAKTVLANANKAFDATQAPFTNATNARNAANNALSAANTRFNNANKAWNGAEASLAAKKKILQETIATPQEQVDIAQARYDSAKAEKTAAAKGLQTAINLRNSLSSQRSKLSSDVAKAQASFDSINASYQKKLAEFNTVQRNYNNAETNKRNKSAALTSAQNNLSSISRDLDSAKNRYNQAVPQINAAKSRLDSARRSLNSAQSAYERAVAGRHTNEEGHSWGTSQSEINSKRAARDRAASTVKTRENEYSSWISRRNAASSDINRLTVAKKSATTVLDTANKEYNAALVSVTNARETFNTVSAQFESITAQYDTAKSNLDTLSTSHQQVEAQYAQAVEQVAAAQKRLDAANKAYASAKETLAALTSNAAGDAATLQYEKETRLALQLAQKEKNDAVNRLNTLQAERDKALQQQAALMKSIAEGGSGSDSLVNATVDSLDDANAVKAQAERDMIVNQQKVTNLKGQLSALADNIENQRNELEKQKRNYDEKLAAHASSRDKVKTVAGQLSSQNGIRVNTEVQIISWEEAKRSGAETIRVSEMNLAGKTLAQSNASHALNSANSLLSSNKAIQKQRQADRDAAKAALSAAEKALAKARMHKSNTSSAVKNYRSWGDAVWTLDQEFRAKDAAWQHRLNNKYRTLSEEQGGGSTGYTQAQIQQAKNDRNAALKVLNSFKNQFTKTSGLIYRGPDSASLANSAMGQVNHYQSKVKSLTDSHYRTYKNSQTAKHTNEEGRTSNAYSQSQINSFKAKWERAARGLQYIQNVRTKLNEDIAARNSLNTAQSEVNRLKKEYATTESVLVAATAKVDKAQTEFNTAQSSLNDANRALEVAKKSVSDAHNAMDQAEKHLAQARVRMDDVEASIGTIRQLLDIAKADEAKALNAVVAARKELNNAQGNLNVAKGELNTTVGFLNKAYTDLQAATTLHGKVSAYLDRATTYKDRAGATLTEAQQLVYLATQAVSRDINAGTVSNDTDYRYDARGQLVSELSATVSYADARADGNVVQHIGRLETRYEYDSLGNVVSSTTAAGTSMANAKRFEFNVMGEQTRSVGLAGGSVIYNDQNLATVNINAEGGRRDKVYNQLGQLRFDVDELGFVTEYRYNGFGQKTTQIRYGNAYTTKRPDGTSIALSDMVKFTASGGASRSLSWNYDKLGQQTATIQGSSLNNDLITDSVTYNAYGEKVSTTRSYKNTTYTTGQHLYSSTGQLLATRDAEGYVTWYGYNGHGELVELRELTARYTDSKGNARPWNLASVEAWKNEQGTAQRHETYTYDNRGNRLTTTRHNAAYHEHSGNSVVDKKGKLITTTYHDYAGRMYMTVQETNTVNKAGHATAANRVLHEYDALGRLVTTWGKEREYVISNVSVAVNGGEQPKRLAAHQRTDYLFDAQGNQVSIITEGRSTFQYFNANGQLTGRKDAQGNYTRVETDAMNRVTRETLEVSTSGALNDSYDKVTSYSYDKTGRQTATTVNSSSGNITESVKYNAFGEVTEKRHNNVVQEKYVYDGFGQVTSATRKGIASSYQYNWLGKVTSETTGGSRVIVREYDNLGNVTRELGQAFDGKAPVTTQTFDRFGNVLTRNVNGSLYSFEYNSNNQVTKQTAPSVNTVDANGNIAKHSPVTLMYYDLSGNRIAVQDANGKWQKSVYDLSGQKLTDINGVGGKTHYYHDARGDMVGRINTLGQGEMFSYNSNGQLLTRAKLNLDKSYAEVYAKYAYDQAGQRYSEEWVGKTGYTQWTRFDQAGRVMETKGGGQHRKFSYDSFGNKTKEIWLENGIQKGVKSAVYNNQGRQTSETWLDGTKVIYEYNSFGEVKRKHGGGLDLRYEYFANGLLKKQTAGGKSEAYQYDINGKEVKRTLTEGAQQLITNSKWDSHGRLESIGTSVAKGFGKTLATSKVTYQYDAVGNRRKVVSQRGSTSQTRWYHYDGDNRMVGSHTKATDIKFSDIGGTAGSRKIQYNAAGQKTHEWVWKSVTREITYESGWESLIRESGNSTVKATVKEENLFGYDVNGHIQSVQSYEYVDRTTRHRTRYLTQANSRSGHALEQNELSTSFKYGANGLIRSGTASTTATKTSFTYSDGRLISQDVVENNRATYGIVFTYHFSGQIAKQSTNVIRERFTDTLTYHYRAKDSYQKIKTTSSSNRRNFKDGVTDFKYNPAGHLYEVTSSKEESRRKVLTDFNGQVAVQLAGDKLTAELSVGGNPLAHLSDSKLDADLLSDSAANTGSQPGAYTVQSNDSLQRISQMVYGDSRYWYLIADANGLSPNDKLTAGKSLVIPNQHTQTYNGAESFKPYNESEVLGNVNPDPIAPPPPKKSCNPIAMIIMVVVAVVVTVYTAGAAGPAFASAFGATGAAAGTAAGVGFASAAGFVAGSAVGAAVGSAASQLVGMALGEVDDFSWKQVALSGLAGGVTAGLTSAINTGAISIPGGTVGEGIARSAASYGTNYVGSKALGMDVSFSWKGMAASAVGGLVSSEIGGYLNEGVSTEFGGIMADTTSGFAGAAASAAIRGDSFSDNAGQMLTDVFGNVLGNRAVREIQQAKFESNVAKMNEYDRLQAMKDGQMKVDRKAIDDFVEHRRNVGIMNQNSQLQEIKETQMAKDRKGLESFVTKQRALEVAKQQQEMQRLKNEQLAAARLKNQVPETQPKLPSVSNKSNVDWMYGGQCTQDNPYGSLHRMNVAYREFEADNPLLAEKFGRQSLPGTVYDVVDGVADVAASTRGASITTSKGHFSGWDPSGKLGKAIYVNDKPSFTKPALAVQEYRPSAATGAVVAHRLASIKAVSQGGAIGAVVGPVGRAIEYKLDGKSIVSKEFAIDASLDAAKGAVSGSAAAYTGAVTAGAVTAVAAAKFGAGVGTAIAPVIGTAVGAAVGFVVGWGVSYAIESGMNNSFWNLRD